MSYTGNEDHTISLNDASKMTKSYRDNMTINQTIIGEYFGKSTLVNILAQRGCVGIRIYYALDTENVQKLVIVGVNSNGDDLYEGILAEMGLTSPPFNSSSNPLNS